MVFQVPPARGSGSRGLVVVASLVYIVLGPGWIRGQPTESFGEEERITAIDLVVDLWEAGSPAGKLPKELTPEDFQVVVGGEPRRVVAVGPPSSGNLSESWQVVIYVDEALSTAATVRWASDLLFGQAEELVRLGEVDLIVAAAEPVFLLRGSRDAGMLRNSLARLSESERGRDELTALRSAFLTALHDETGDYTPEELRTALRAEEERLIRGRLDMLLTFMADDAGLGSRRVLFFVSDGFDLVPDEFYSMWSTLESEPPGSESPPKETVLDLGSGLEEVVTATARALSAYGWITHPLVAPERPSPLVPGLRVGKWRVSGPAGGRIIGLRIVREHQRKKQKAEDLVELGLAQMEKGEAEKAEEAFRQALVHFSGDPRTAQSQAQAFLGLSESLAQQGEDQGAREALAQAALLDPSIEQQNPETIAALWEPLEPLELLARESSGGFVRDESDMGRVAEELGRRLRLTYQEVGAPGGRMLPVSVQWASHEGALRSPAWTRFGTPEDVAAARARRLLAGEFADTELELDLVVQISQPGGGWHLQATFEEPPDLEGWQEDRLLRVTMATAAPEVPTRVSHHLLRGSGEEPWPVFSSRVVTAGPETWLVVVMEDLATGHWAADVVELN